MGIAAGFDKQAEAVLGLQDLGFGFVEVIKFLFYFKALFSISTYFLAVSRINGHDTVGKFLVQLFIVFFGQSHLPAAPTFHIS